MTLAELSKDYEAAAVPLRARLRELRRLLTAETDPEAVWHLQRRIAELTTMLPQMNELAELQRQTLTAYYFHQQTIPQIARERGVNKSTLSRTLRRAEEKLRRYLRY